MRVVDLEIMMELPWILLLMKQAMLVLGLMSCSPSIIP